MGRAAPDPHGSAWARSAVGVAILAVLLWQVGADPFVTALTEITWWALLAALVITVLTTVCAAWRWSTVATGLGVRIGLPAAVAAYYRSQFLNSVLPGGVLGDVHRAVRHGHDVHRMGRGVRSVVWERVLGQVVQVVLTVVLLLVLPSPLRPIALVAAAVLVVLGAMAVVIYRSRQSNPVAEVRAPPVARSHAPRGRLEATTVTIVVLTSVLAVLGHVTVFLVAMSAAGVEVSLGRQVALALIVLLGAAIPASLAGWGPREGVAAWAFEAAGLGAAAGVSVAVLYGVLALVATLPGAILLVPPRLHPPRSRSLRRETDPTPRSLRCERPLGREPRNEVTPR